MWFFAVLSCRSTSTSDTDGAHDSEHHSAVTPGTGDTRGDATGPHESADHTGRPPIVVPITLTLHESFGSVVVAHWDQPEDGSPHVEYRSEGDSWLESPSVARAAGPQEQVLLGLPYGTTAEARLVWGDDPPGPSTAIATAALPEGLPVPELRTADEAGWWPDGQYLLGSINQDGGGWAPGRYWMFVLDRRGRVVWARRGVGRNMTIYLQVSSTGEILWDESTFWSSFDSGAGSRIHRMTLGGTETAVVDAPGMHHCFRELPEGSLVWGSAQSRGDERLLRRWPDGHVTTEWDCGPFYAQLGLTDWCHTNSIFYDESRDRYLLSFPTRDTFVLEVDARSGDEVRWFGHIPGSWAFDQPSSEFQYQHGVTWTATGTLLMSSQLTDTDPDALVREYVLDEGTETLTQVWAFGAGDGIDAQNAGEAHDLPNGSRLHNTGTTPRIREITPDGRVVWDVAFEGNRLLGRTVFVPDLYALVF